MKRKLKRSGKKKPVAQKKHGKSSRSASKKHKHSKIAKIKHWLKNRKKKKR